MRITRKITGKRGGPGRGQGRTKLPKDIKCIQTQVYIPPEILEKIKDFQPITGDSLSATILYLIDHGIASLKNK